MPPKDTNSGAGCGIFIACLIVVVIVLFVMSIFDFEMVTEIGGFLLVFGVVISIMTAMSTNRQEKRARVKRNQDFEEQVAEVQTQYGFYPDDAGVLYHYTPKMTKRYMALLNPDGQSLVLYEYPANTILELTMSEIISCDMVENGHAIQGDTAGNVLLGAASLGRTGALLGGLASKDSDNVVTDMYLRIVTNRANQQLVSIVGIEEKVSMEKYSDYVRQARQYLDRIYAYIQAALSKSSLQQTPASASDSIANKLTQLKGLLESGLISEMEYEASRKEILQGLSVGR